MGWSLAIAVRLTYFPFVQVTSDTLSPFVGAIRWLHTGWFQPANPESDQWLWFLSLPLVWIADGLGSLFWWKCIATTVVVPVSMWLVGKQVQTHKLFWMLMMAMVLTLDMGLVDTMLSGFRGYWAPECMAFACVGLWQWGRGKVFGAHVTTVFTIVGMGQHPLVLGCGLSLVWLWYQMYKRGESWWLSVLLAVLFLVPRMFWVWELLQCDAGGWACIQEISVSSSEDTSTVELLKRVVVDRLWIEMGLASGIMLLGWYRSTDKSFQSWIIWSVVGVVLLGLSVSTLRPYHFRVLIVPMFLFAVDGLSKWGGLGRVLGACWMVMVLWYRIEPVDWYTTVEETDEVAGFLCAQTEPIWLEGYGESLDASPQSVGVSMILQGCEVTFASSPTEKLWVLQQTDRFNTTDIQWQNNGYQLLLVTKEDWMKVPASQQWSGHDLAILQWHPNQVQLEW